MDIYSIYLHVPFCSHRCSYCDFNTYAGQESLIPDYIRALCAEIKAATAVNGYRLPVHTLFFGGGTPSLLKPGDIEQLLNILANSFKLAPGIEITLEANPGTLSLAYLRDLRQLGINRISLGAQSANPFELQLLERQHNYSATAQSVTWARRAGFDNLNLDLIYGLPNQTLTSWQRSLELAIGLQPEHFSLYALTIEHGTPLEQWTRRGLVDAPDPDLAADMYDLATELLALKGFQQYEISNWAQARQDDLLTCRHNLQYWRGLPYLGFGAGAHGYAAGYRTANVLSPSVYIHRCLDSDLTKQDLPDFPGTPATQILTRLDSQAEIGEFMMMGLRLVQEGISSQVFQTRFGSTIQEMFGPQINRLVDLGLLEWYESNGDILRLTKAGRLLGNQVFIEFI